jgi:hypothetical protein
VGLHWQGDSKSIDRTLAAILLGDGKVSRLALANVSARVRAPRRSSPID